MLQDPDLVIHRMRLRYLSQMQDGIGERILDFSNTKTNSTAFKIAGGDLSLMNRCVSPDIPTHDSTEFSNMALNRGEVTSPVSSQPSEDVIGGGTLRRTITDLSLQSRRSRSNLNEEFNLARLNPALRDDEASDQSDLSEVEESTIQTYGSQQKHLFMIDLHKRIAEEPKFEKIPIRRRGASDASVTYRGPIVPPHRRPTFSILKNESESDLSKTGTQSVLSEGFMPIAPGAPFDSPLLGVPLQSGTPDALDEYGTTITAFEAAEDSESEDDFDLVHGSMNIGNTDLTNPISISAYSPRILPIDSGSAPTIESLPKTKPRPESVFQPTSGLTALIRASEAAEVNPLERKFGILSGKGDLKPLKLKMYRPSSKTPNKPFSVLIRNSATVLEAIGYSLLRYIEDHLEPVLTADQQDPNYWTLRIVEDDGELDEDFPALERTRPISKFSFDEFALVEATAAQLLENQSLTPDPLGTKLTLKTIPEVNIQAASGPPTPQTQLQHVEESFIPSNIMPSSHAPSVAASHSIAGSVKPVPRAPGASVLLKVRLRPDPGMPNSIVHAQSTVLDVTTETYLGDVLDQVCKRRNLDKYMFSLRIAGTNVVVPSDRTVESLQGRTELLLIRKRPTDLLTDAAAPRSMTPNAPIMLSNTYTVSKLGHADGASSSNLSRYLPDIVTTNTYQRWIVWRRQPMSFMGRHERILAIDGEYVHISPSESKTMFETPKTSSLHVGQIVACKQSRKIPINFKIVIIKAAQTKRYDFEAVRVQEAETIVSKIKTLTRNWNSRSVRGMSSRIVS